MFGGPLSSIQNVYNFFDQVTDVEIRDKSHCFTIGGGHIESICLSKIVNLAEFQPRN